MGKWFSLGGPWNPPLCTNGSAGYLMQLSVNTVIHLYTSKQDKLSSRLVSGECHIQVTWMGCSIMYVCMFVCLFVCFCLFVCLFILLFTFIF